MTEVVADPAVTFEAFFASRHESAVRGAFLLTFSETAAEDIVQDAFGQLLRRWEVIRRPDAYLWRAITNGARSWGRRERRIGPAEPVTLAHVDEDAVAVRQALADLPRPQREALVMRYFLALREREIADAMGCPPGTVKSHIHRGLAALKERLR
jgi:RNA polymerase sigma factor (sigma-70 family)